MGGQGAGNMEDQHCLLQRGKEKRERENAAGRQRETGLVGGKRGTLRD